MVLFLLLLLLTVCQSLDIFVSKYGDDNNSGLRLHKSLKSINAAQKLIRNIKRDNNDKVPLEGINVLISPGINYESLNLSSLDLGSIKSPIKWYGIGYDEVKISKHGLQIDLSSFYPHTSSPLKCVDLKKLNITIIVICHIIIMMN